MAAKLADLLKEREATITLSPAWKKKGYIAISNSMIFNAVITPGAFRLYCYLLSRCFQKDNCFPSAERIAKDLHINRKTVFANKKELIENKLMRAVRRGKGKTNVYLLKE